MPTDPNAGPDPATSYAYDAQGRLTAVRGPRGPVTRTEYDADGRLIGPAVDPPPAPAAEADATPDQPHVVE